MPPTFVCPIYSYTPKHLYTPGVYNPHMSPILLCICMFSEASACCGGVVRGPLTYWTLSLHLPLYGGASPSVYAHSFVSFPVHQYVSGISVCHMGIFPLCWGLGVFPHLLGDLGGISTWDVHMLILVHSCSLLYLRFLLWL